MVQENALQCQGSYVTIWPNKSGRFIHPALCVKFLHPFVANLPQGHLALVNWQLLAASKLWPAIWALLLSMAELRNCDLPRLFS